VLASRSQRLSISRFARNRVAERRPDIVTCDRYSDPRKSMLRFAALV
jgi:hypothetical protein